MKKIPTLFERVFEDNRVKEVLNKVTPGMEWVLAGEGTATVKYDGACCAMIDGVFHRRYDCKKGRSHQQDSSHVVNQIQLPDIGLDG